MLSRIKEIRRFRYKDQTHNHETNSELFIRNLSKFKNKPMTLKFIEHNSEQNHRYAKLSLPGHVDGFSDSDGIIKGIVKSDTIKFDCIPIVMVKKKEGEKRVSKDPLNKSDGRIMLTIYDTEPIHKDISNIIRHIEPNVSDQMKVLSVGFPYYATEFQKIVCFVFEKPLVYYANEIKLSNGTKSISPIDQSHYPIHFLDFNLNNFSVNDYSNLSLKCEKFNIEVLLPIAFPNYIRRFYSNIPLFPDVPEGSQPSAIDKTNKDTNEKTQLFNAYGIFGRYRYDSEINRGNHSALKAFHIKNLRNYIGRRIILNLFLWGSDRPHPSLELYITKPNAQFQNVDGHIEGIIRSNELRLEFVGIKKRIHIRDFNEHVEVFARQVSMDTQICPLPSTSDVEIQETVFRQRKKDKNNCRIEVIIEQNEYSEISNVIRNLPAKYHKEIMIKVIGFPDTQNVGDKIIHIIFAQQLAYFRDEFELCNGAEPIKAIGDLGKELSFTILGFNLTEFSSYLQPILLLKCRIFNLILRIKTDGIQKVYSPPIPEERRVERENVEEFPRQVSMDTQICPLPKTSDVEMQETLPPNLNCPRQRSTYKRNLESHTENVGEMPLKKQKSQMDEDDLEFPLPFNVYEYVKKKDDKFASLVPYLHTLRASPTESDDSE